MRVEFTTNTNGPERLAAEATLVFDEPGPLAGLKLVGFSIWRSPEGTFYVTFPSRAFGAGVERRYFDYLRSAGDGLEPVKRLKAWILEEHQKATNAAA